MRQRYARRWTQHVASAALACACACTGMSLGAGETITVTLALDDFMDFGGAQRVEDLPGPDGGITLREAVTAANNTPGPQTIVFAIPTSEWWFLYGDRAIVRLEMMLQLTDAGTTIDFASQTAFTGDTNPNGNEVGLYYLGPPASIPSLWLMADGCTVKGLDVGLGNNFGNTVWISGNSNRVIGCTTGGLTVRGDYGGGDGNTIGGIGADEGNLFTDAVGIYSGASGNTVIGNRIRWGIRIAGDPNNGVCEGNRIGGPARGERNSIAGRGSFSSEGFPQGVQVEVSMARGTLVEHNYIGTTVDGSAKLPGHSGSGGISIGAGAVDTIVRDNTVSGFEMTGVGHALGLRFGTAIGIGSGAAGTVVAGNRIGVSSDGLTPILNVDGIVVATDAVGTPIATRIGGPGAGDGNTISTCERGGVRVLYGASGVWITRNSIGGNPGLGIDLAGTVGLGVTPNDPLDIDVGGNGLQNFPVLASVAAAARSTVVAGTLESAVGASFELEFFASPSCDASGHGEGREFLGSTIVTTDAGGRASFDIVLPVSISVGVAVTATATGMVDRATSEFSACVEATAGCPADLTGDGVVGAPDLAALLSNWGGAGTGDINGDGVVGAQDIAALLAAWGACAG